MTGNTNLSARDCWELLRSSEVGRLAVQLPYGVDLFPINYVVDGGTIVFRTAVGSKLDGAMGGGGVAFEIDSYHLDSSAVWSVVIRGRARPIARIEELLDTAALPLLPWEGSAKPQFIRITPDVISGRTFAKADVSTWESQLTDAHRGSPE